MKLKNESQDRYNSFAILRCRLPAISFFFHIISSELRSFRSVFFICKICLIQRIKEASLAKASHLHFHKTYRSQSLKAGIPRRIITLENNDTSTGGVIKLGSGDLYNCFSARTSVTKFGRYNLEDNPS